MAAIHQHSLLKIRGNSEFFQELANGRSRTRVQVKLFLACGRVFVQVSEEMHVDGHELAHSSWGRFANRPYGQV